MNINISIDGKILTEQIDAGVPVNMHVERLDLNRHYSYSFMDAVNNGIFTMAEWTTLRAAMDIISLKFENNKNTIFVKYTDGLKEVDLSESHIRVMDGEERRDPMVAGTPIHLTIIKDLGIFSNPTVARGQISIGFKEDFSQETIDLLASLGVVFTGNGEKFVVGVNGRPIKILFENKDTENTVFVKNDYTDNGIVIE